MRLELPAGLDGHRRRIRRGGYPSRKAAVAVLARLRAPRTGDTGARMLTVGDWLSEGLLALFFLVVGLEIRREMSAGALTDIRAAVLPVVAALGGVVAPAVIYLTASSRRSRPGRRMSSCRCSHSRLPASICVSTCCHRDRDRFCSASCSDW